MVTEDFKKSAQDIVNAFKGEIAGVRANRPSSTLVEDLKVSYYGQMMPLKQVGSVSVVPPRQISIEVWDKEAVAEVVKAIESSSLGFTANTEGNIIRIFLPELSEERRKELIKHVNRIAEDSRIKLRHFRDDANKKIGAMSDGGEISEDDEFRMKKEIQNTTEKTNEEIERMAGEKGKEINA